MWPLTYIWPWLDLRTWWTSMPTMQFNQKSFRSKVTARKQTDTHWSNYSTWVTKLVGNVTRGTQARLTTVNNGWSSHLTSPLASLQSSLARSALSVHVVYRYVTLTRKSRRLSVNATDDDSALGVKFSGAGVPHVPLKLPRHFAGSHTSSYVQLP